ncbi:P4HA3 hydroxylase, partial [Alaudala cheleensis]|nr:P4HA3 hydroxylase [Alaudala cheleensis]
RFYEKVQALHQDPEALVDNPLLAFSLIKRLHSDWPNIVYSEEATRNTQALHAGLREMEQELPGTEDLDGAARALMRLQDIYALSVKGLAKGIFQRARHPLLCSPGRHVSLSANNCFHMGKMAYDTGDYYHSIAWLEEALSLFCHSCDSWNLEDQSSLEDTLDHLAFSYFMAGNVSHALSLSREFLCYTDPSNQRVSRNVAKYKKLLKMGTWENWQGCQGPPPLLSPLHALLGPFSPQPAPERLLPLSCSYETNSNPYLLLQPAKEPQPYVVLYHDFITDAEAEAIKGLAGLWV